MTVLKKFASRHGGKLIGYYFAVGEYHFLTIVEVSDEHAWAQALIVAAVTGGVPT